MVLKLLCHNGTPKIRFPSAEICLEHRQFNFNAAEQPIGTRRTTVVPKLHPEWRRLRDGERPHRNLVHPALAVSAETLYSAVIGSLEQNQVVFVDHIRK